MENSTIFGDFKYPTARTTREKNQQVCRRNKQNYPSTVLINKPGIISAETCFLP